MSKFSDRLRALRTERYMSQMELSKYIGVSKSSINMYERGEREPGIETLEAFADFFNVDMDFLIGKSNVANKFSTDIPTAKNIIPMPETYKAPLLGRIACGEPILAVENIEDYIDIPKNINADFGLECKGDSMIGADIRSGDIVYIKMTPEVQDGEIAAVLIGDEATLKRVYYDREHSELTLYAENPAYSALRYRGAELEQIRIIGRAVGLSRSLVPRK